MYKQTNNISRENDHYLGHSFAPVEVIQYGDFQCDHCVEVYPVIKLLLETMRADIKFIFRHYPLHLIHPLALDAAIAAEAAAAQGKFWYMHDMIFENQKHLLRTSFSNFAAEINLDMKEFEDSRSHKRLFHKVINDFESGVRSGVNCTPTFIINNKRYGGFDDFEHLYQTCRYAATIGAPAI